MIALLMALAAQPSPVTGGLVMLPPMACELGMAGLKSSIAATPGVRHAPYPRPSAFDTYYDDAHSTIYFETTPGQPADPAIVRVIVTTENGKTVVTPSACVFGDKDRTQQLFESVQALMSAPPPAPGNAR